MISKLDRSCNWDNKNRPAIATRINSLSSLLLENIGSPTKQWFSDNLRHLPPPPVTPSTKVESSAYPGELMTDAFLTSIEEALKADGSERALLLLGYRNIRDKELKILTGLSVATRPTDGFTQFSIRSERKPAGSVAKTRTSRTSRNLARVCFHPFTVSGTTGTEAGHCRRCSNGVGRCSSVGTGTQDAGGVQEW